MKKYLLVLIVVFMSFDLAASCGGVPAEPALVNQDVLTVAQLHQLDPQMESYFATIQNYIICVDMQAMSLDREAPDYEESYSDFMQLIEFVEEKKQLTIDRYSALVSNGVDANPAP